MSADFSPLDTSQRQKVLAMIDQLSNAGLSESDIQRYFQGAMGAGQQALGQYYNSAATQLGLSSQPQLQAATNRLGSSPLLADSGYANRLNRQIQTDLYARLAGDYGQHAADMAGQNVGFLRDLYGQRIQGRQALAGNAYQTMFNSPKKKKFGAQLADFGSQAVGSAAGAFAGGG